MTGTDARSATEARGTQDALHGGGGASSREKAAASWRPPTDWLGRTTFCVGVRYDYPDGDVLRITVRQRAWGRWSAALLGLWSSRGDAEAGWARITLESVSL